MNINYTAPICSTGYGHAALNILMELVKENNVSLFPLGHIEADQSTHDTIRQCIENQHTFDYDAPSVRVFHQFDMAHSVGRGPRVGFPIFELDTFNARELHHLKSLDKILVCSSWAKSVIESNGIDVPTYVVPLGVDRNVFNENVKRSRKLEDETCHFLNVGKWEKRKGHDIIAEAFEIAFNPSDNVKLVMHCANPFLTDEEHKEWRSLYENNKLHKENKILMTVGRLALHTDIARLMQDCDVGVFPARAEGWNLELLEMMSMGKQVIATDYSGHTEFCNSDNTHLISVTDKEPAYDDKWFFGDGNWASVDVEELARKMYEVYSSGAWTTRNDAGISTAEKFSWSNSAQQLIKALAE
jgi:glycosyltransferase involved in cell wall biosynthesis